MWGFILNCNILLASFTEIVKRTKKKKKLLFYWIFIYLLMPLLSIVCIFIFLYNAIIECEVLYNHTYLVN